MAAAGCVACLLALAVLWQLRPALPAEWTFDAVVVGQVLRLLLWLTLTLLALVLLAHAVRIRAATPPFEPEPGPQRGGARRQRRVALLDLVDNDRAHPAIGTAAELRHHLPSWARPRLNIVAPVDGPAAVVAPPPPSAAAPPAVVADEPMHASRLLLLGPLEIPSPMRRRRRSLGPAHELIAFLALHPEGASRDELLEALWPEEDPVRSTQRFWQTSKEARKLLDGGIVRESGRYRLDRDHVDVDVDRLETLLQRADAAADELAEQQLVEQALALFRGEPLEGCDFRWAASATRRLAARRLELLERAGRARLANGDARGALDAAERGIAADELSERFWQIALEAEAAAGAREAVGRRYEELRERLDERLGLQPNAETRALYLRLLGPGD